jgi:hypothetical protein
VRVDEQALHGGAHVLRRQIVHALPPAAESRKFWAHRLPFGGKAEGERARQQIEIGNRELGPEAKVVAVRKLAFGDS